MKLLDAKTDVNPRGGITNREAEIVRLVAAGLSSREIAERLYRSPRTIENHLRSVYRKLGVKNRVQLVKAAAGFGLVEAASKPGGVRMPREIEAKVRAFDILRELDERLASVAQGAYFGELVLNLAACFGARWAGISEAAPPGEPFDVIVLAGDGRLEAQAQCHLSTSPCGDVLKHGSLVVPQGVRGRYPNWSANEVLPVESYAGVRLDDPGGAAVGILWIVDDKPLNMELLPGAVLSLLARRTAVELVLARSLDDRGFSVHDN